ncbi:MAG: hypothetical protein EON55_04560 [Alphaproteobacteria bacterium]|nr:MAG: hypothetical protein EON55_04560 [Alphaproteobacteria bacterium]
MGRASFDPALGPPGDSRTLHPGNAPIPTSDGWLSVSANTDGQVAAFLRAAGRAEALNDPRFASVTDRIANVEAWFALRNGALRDNTSAYWLRTLAAADVPAMPCHTLDSLMMDPHLQAAGLLGQGYHPTLGNVRTIRPTVLRDDQADRCGRPAAPIGWDTVPVLSEAGFSDAEIAELVATGAAVDGHLA